MKPMRRSKSSAAASKSEMSLEALQTLARDLVRFARRRGADQVQVAIEYEDEFRADVRMGSVESLVDAGSAELSLRVLQDHKVAVANSSDLSVDALRGLALRAIARARHSQKDPFAALPELVRPRRDESPLDIYDGSVTRLSVAKKIDRALAAEAAGRAADARITNSHGASFSATRTLVVLANSNGFHGAYPQSEYSLSLGLQAGTGTRKSEEFCFAQATHLSDLVSPKSLGRETARRAVQLIGARKVKTQKVPVIFDPRMSAHLLYELLDALSGAAVYRGASFLAGKLGEKIGSDALTLIDDGLMPRGLGSRPFDDEGAPAQRTMVCEGGVLQTYLCNTYAARKLKLRSTGNDHNGGIGPKNFYLPAGPYTPEQMIRSVKKGLYLTRTIGQGVNEVTGDYSKGAYGLWIRNGELAYPIAEVTISSTLQEMMRGLEMVGNDLAFHSQIGAPTIKIHEMTIAGL